MRFLYLCFLLTVQPPPLTVWLIKRFPPCLSRLWLRAACDETEGDPQTGPRADGAASYAPVNICWDRTVWCHRHATVCVCVFLLAGLAVKAAALVPRKPSNRLLNPCFICCVITSASQAVPRQFFTTSHPSSQLCVLCPFPPLPNLSLYASTACFSAPSTPYASPSPPLIHLSPLPSPVIPSVAVLTFSLPSSFP